MTKILCITNDFGPRAGGIETFIIGLIERAPFGSITVFTSNQGDTSIYDANWLKNFGVQVIRDSSKILLPTPRVSRRVNKIVISKQIEAAFFGAAAPLGLLASGLHRSGVKKIIALTHGHEVWWAKLWPFSSAIKRIGKRVDHLTYLGEFTRAAISKALTPAAAGAMVKIAPGIDTDHFAPTPEAKFLRAELGLSQKKVIVNVGRLVHRKGQDILIAAMPRVLQEHPDAHILLIGEGPYRLHLEKLVTKLKISHAITFIGRIHYDQLPKYICAGDVFVMPSRTRFAGLEVEGLGIVYLEASACALPVIAGNSGGAPDAVVSGLTGYCVDGRDKDEVAATIITIFDNPDASKQMGLAGRQWIIDKWRWEIWSTQFNKLFNH